jgi:serine O-acetyltransferase
MADDHPGSQQTVREALRLLRADVAAAERMLQGGWLARLFPNLFPVACYRIGHYLWHRGARGPAHVLAVLGHMVSGAEIRPEAIIGPGFVIVHPTAIVIAGGVVAGERLQLFGSNTVGYNKPSGGPGGCPRLGDNVSLFNHASVLGPVAVGDGARIPAYALMLSDVPSAGAPRESEA